MATAGSIVIDLLMRTGAFESDVGRAEKRLKEMQKRAVDAGKAIGTAIAGGAVIAGTALAAMAKNGIDAADRLDELSQRLGVSTEKLSGLGYAATLTGGNIDTIAGALPRLSKAIIAAGDDSSKMGQLFKAMGVDVKDAAGNFRDVEDVLPEVMDAFKGLKDDTLEQALAMEVFGKSGAEMLEFLNLGSDGLADMQKRAEDLGIVVSGDTAAAAAEFNDKLGDLRLATEAFATKLAAELLPALTELLQKVTAFVSDGENARKTVDGLTTGFNFVSDALTGVADIFRIVGETIGGALASMKGFYDVAAGLVQLDWGRIEFGASMINEGRKGAVAALFRGEDSQGNSLIRLGNDEPEQGVSLNFVEATGSGVTVNGRADTAANSAFGNRGQVDAQQKKIDALQREIGRLLENRGTGGGGRKPAAARPEKSEAEKQAEALTRQYEQLQERQRETIALFELEGEAAKVRYEIEHGALKGLDEARAQEAIANAEVIDTLERKKELLDEYNATREQAEGVLQAIAEETEALRMSNEQWEIANNLKAAGVGIETELGQQIARSTSELYAQREAISDQVAVLDEFRQGASNALSDFVTGTKSAKDALNDFFDDLFARITQVIADRWIEQLFGSMGTTGGGTAGGDWFSSLLGGLFGGGTGGGTAGAGGAAASGGASGGGFWAGLFSSFFGGGYAQGGQILGGRSYLVGENGPEMFVPRTAGTVIPNPDPVSKRHGSGSAMGVVNNFNLGAPTDPRTQAQIANRVGFETQRQMNRSR